MMWEIVLKLKHRHKMSLTEISSLFFYGRISKTCIPMQFFLYVDERRMKIVEMGGVQELLKTLEGAKDDRTRKEAFKALVALSHSGLI